MLRIELNQYNFLCTAQAHMSMCKIQTSESPRSPKIQPNLYWMGSYEVHACMYIVGIVWLVLVCYSMYVLASSMAKAE